MSLGDAVTVTSAAPAEGEIICVDVHGEDVALTRVGGVLYAFQDDCTHEPCPLSAGDIEGSAVFCPCHGSKFDMKDGSVLAGPAEDPLRIYEVEEVSSGIVIRPGQR